MYHVALGRFLLRGGRLRCMLLDSSVSRGGSDVILTFSEQHVQSTVASGPAGAVATGKLQQYQCLGHGSEQSAYHSSGRSAGGTIVARKCAMLQVMALTCKWFDAAPKGLGGRPGCLAT